MFISIIQTTEQDSAPLSGGTVTSLKYAHPVPSGIGSLSHDSTLRANPSRFFSAAFTGLTSQNIEESQNKGADPEDRIFMFRQPIMQTAWRKSKDNVQLVLVGVDVISAVCIYFSIREGICKPPTPFGQHQILEPIKTTSPKGQPPPNPFAAAAMSAAGRRRMSEGRKRLLEARGGRSLTDARHMVGKMHSPQPVAYTSDDIGLGLADDIDGVDDMGTETKNATVEVEVVDTPSGKLVVPTWRWINAARKARGLEEKSLEEAIMENGMKAKAAMIEIQCKVALALGKTCYKWKDKQSDDPEYGCMAFTVNLVTMYYPLKGLSYTLYFVIPFVFMFTFVQIMAKQGEPPLPPTSPPPGRPHARTRLPPPLLLHRGGVGGGAQAVGVGASGGGWSVLEVKSK